MSEIDDTDTDDAALVPARNGTVRAVEEGRSVEIIDETPVNMLIRVYEDDGPRTLNKAKNARNELLFKHGLYDLVYGQGDEILVLNDEPYAAVASHEQAGTFTVWVNDEPPIETPPSMEEDVLEAVKAMVEGDDESIVPLTTIHQTILDTQVRRYVINRLLEVPPFSVFAERGAIESDERGWLLHGQLLLTWDGEFRNQSNEDNRYEVAGSGVRRVESVNEAFKLSRRSGQQHVTTYDRERQEAEGRVTVEFGDATHTFGEQEIEFVSRVIWALKSVRPRGPRSDHSALESESESESDAESEPESPDQETQQ